MKLDSMERQPTGAYYARLLKVSLILLAISAFMGIAMQNFYEFTTFLIVLGLCVGVPYAIYQKLRYNNYRYCVSQDKITVEAGIITKNTNAILFNLIRDVNVNEPIFLRVFDLAKLQFTTPSDYVEIALLKGDAISIQNLMTAKMSVDRVGIVAH